MKKILLFAALLPAILFSQIGPIQTEEKPLEFISGVIYSAQKLRTSTLCKS